MNDERGQKAVAPSTQKGRPRNDDVHFQRDGRVALKVLRRHAEHRPHHRGAELGLHRHPGRQRDTEALWALPHLECRPRSAPGCDVPPGPKTQLSRLSNNSFFSQMKTCPKAGRLAPLLSLTLGVLPSWPQLYHSQQILQGCRPARVLLEVTIEEIGPLSQIMKTFPLTSNFHQCCVILSLTDFL